VVDGSVDESYGDGGIVIVDFPGVVAQANAVLVERGGEAVLAGGAVSNSPDVLLAKLRADGALDSGFGSDGRVITPLTPTDGAQGAVAIARHGDERFIVGASTVVSGQLGFAVLGYLRDGTLDPKFGVDGIATALPAPGGAALQALIVQRDGKIIAVGGGTDAAGNATFVAARFTPRGTLDPTFNSDGTRIIDTPEGDAVANAVALQPDERIVLAGTAQISNGANNVFARLNPDGSNDTNFGDGGLVLTQTMPDQDLGGMSAVGVQRDGDIVATGLGGTDVNFRGQFATLRLLPDGNPDPSFGNGQGFVTTMVGEDSIARALILLNNGEIIAAGAGGPAAGSAFALVSYRADGSLNEQFGTGGIVETPIGAISGITDAELHERTRLTAVGGTANADVSQASFAAARYALQP
jgi:uncharacterized delta-60 repeat protein